jgi:hypothetical protein
VQPLPLPSRRTPPANSLLPHEAYFFACPVCREGKPILALSNCYVSLPVSNLALLHFIRNPLDIAISAYLYHMQDPPPEKWIEQMKVRAAPCTDHLLLSCPVVRACGLLRCMPCVAVLGKTSLLGHLSLMWQPPGTMQSTWLDAAALLAPPPASSKGPRRHAAAIAWPGN